MKKVAFALACSSCIGHGRQIYEDFNEAQLLTEEPVSALAEFLLALNPGAALAPRARTSVIDMMARRPVVGGNWKCNPTSKNDLDGLIENINACDTGGCDVYVCPSPLHVDYCIDKFTNGAMVTPQNCNFKGTGA
jgi:hypothetical protein